VKRLLLLIAVAGCHHDEPEPPAKVAKVHCVAPEMRVWAEVRSLRGTVAALPDRDAIVAAQVPGRLLRVLVREGDHVERGAVVAEVESQPLKDALRQLEAQLAQVTAAREAAALAITREQHLYDRGISARQSLEQAKASLGQSDGAVAAATAQTDAARQNVARTLVRAPISGVVVRLHKRVGELVDGTPATPLLQIADPTVLELAATAPAADLMTLAAKQPATITFDALPGRSFPATVRAVSPSVDAATGVGSVRLSLQPTSDGRMPPIGLLGTAEVTVGAARNALTVPAAAVRNAGGARSEVVLCQDGKAHPLVVTVGERRQGMVELQGLAPSARVAVDELPGLEEGMQLEEQKP